MSINLQKADWDVIGSIGHELRHTIEVLADATVTTNDRARMFYRISVRPAAHSNRLRRLRP